MGKIYTQSQLNNLARKIIAKNQYATIASADLKSNPWISPVAYCYDEKWNIYFISMPSSKHSQNLKHKKSATVAIFDSHQKWGVGVGLQIEADIIGVPIYIYPEIAKIYFWRDYPYGKVTLDMISDFAKLLMEKKKVYRFYKIVPKKIWMNDPNSSVDERVEINLY